MSKVEKVSISLTRAQAETVRQAVESGDYGSSSEVVREALRAWSLKREREEAEREWLRAAIQEGIDSGFDGFRGFDELRNDILSSVQSKPEFQKAG